ncbi:hypothetical protein [Celerinatantimonas sp. YJH-8]|uniref:hypothetical protein n=1 Tax=Celerinatantimonas sp. YJH-8 TaxID=3228714 RepID=UPI0038C7C2FF
MTDTLLKGSMELREWRKVFNPSKLKQEQDDSQQVKSSSLVTLKPKTKEVKQASFTL